ncbi:hypothetical protein NE237_007204 [Protea cynaroides]|uniref:LITAF domain-containing protein n=1 Tax=Protea cynaroides TaxID=273540 RepID=A0A9Q0KP08_9MAGN|nr:hypothetical protein NE237_007204 [Protea cynaroides]
MTKSQDPVVGIPVQHEQYYVGQNPYQAGAIPPNAIFNDPKGIPLQQTMFRDTPAPFSCVYCGNSGVTTIRSKLSQAAVVGCMMPFMLGICFLCPSMDCLWHKYHYCPNCKEKVADFEKSDPCLVNRIPEYLFSLYLRAVGWGFWASTFSLLSS